MRRTAALGAATAVLLAGCGGGNDKSTTRLAFIKSAEQVCKRGNAALAPITKQVKQAQKGKDTSKIYQRVGSLTQQAAKQSLTYVNKLDALDTPKADRDRLKGWITMLRRQENLVGQLGAAYAKRDSKQIARLAEKVDQLNQTSNAFAQNYGMLNCAQTVGS